jgi:hypothetical protein
VAQTLENDPPLREYWLVLHLTTARRRRNNAGLENGSVKLSTVFGTLE